jgi:hypothetical protein
LQCYFNGNLTFGGFHVDGIRNKWLSALI